MIMQMILAGALAMPLSPYDCTVSQVAWLSYKDGKADASAINGVPANALKFGLQFKGEKATVVWPDSPIQASGVQPVLPTGPNAGLVMFVSAGPCLFTERACATMLNFAEQPDKTLKILITPSAITSDEDHKTRAPFLVYMDGLCVARKQ